MEFELVGPSAAARFLVPTVRDVVAGWEGTGFDDAEWKLGNSAFGYDRRVLSGFELLLGQDSAPELFSRETSIYVRYPFSVLPSVPIDVSVRDWDVLDLRLPQSDTPPENVRVTLEGSVDLESYSWSRLATWRFLDGWNSTDRKVVIFPLQKEPSESLAQIRGLGAESFYYRLLFELLD